MTRNRSEKTGEMTGDVLLICAATARELVAAVPGLLPDRGTDAARAQDALREFQPVPVRLPGRPSLWPAGGRAGARWRDALLCVTGVGPVNAALALGFCFGLTAGQGGEQAEPAARPGVSGRIGAVLLVGLAGAFDLGQHPLRSLCVVREELWPEYGLNDGSTVTARAFSFPLWKRADGAREDVYDSIGLADPRGLFAMRENAGLADCRSLTVAGVSASVARARAMRQRYQADLENMEGFAVAYACARAGVPCAEIRAVSNKVGPRAPGEKDFAGALGALGGVLPALGL